jgi:spore germination cell wall hydrolase CwlJ-like protein
MLRLLTALLAFLPIKTSSGTFPTIAQPSKAEIRCLADIVYHEARGESKKGQEAVMHVALNRAQRNNSSVCKELVKPNQFSFYKGKVHNVSDAWMQKAKTMLLWDMHGYRRDFTQGSIHFVRADVLESQTWAQKMKRVMVIGKHVLLKEE